MMDNQGPSDLPPPPSTELQIDPSPTMIQEGPLKLWVRDKWVPVWAKVERAHLVLYEVDSKGQQGQNEMGRAAVNERVKRGAPGGISCPSGEDNCQFALGDSLLLSAPSFVSSLEWMSALKSYSKEVSRARESISQQSSSEPEGVKTFMTGLLSPRSSGAAKPASPKVPKAKGSTWRKSFGKESEHEVTSSIPSTPPPAITASGPTTASPSSGATTPEGSGSREGSRKASSRRASSRTKVSDGGDVIPSDDAAHHLSLTKKAAELLLRKKEREERKNQREETRASAWPEPATAAWPEPSTAVPTAHGSVVKVRVPTGPATTATTSPAPRSGSPVGGSPRASQKQPPVAKLFDPPSDASVAATGPLAVPAKTRCTECLAYKDSLEVSLVRIVSLGEKAARMVCGPCVVAVKGRIINDKEKDALRKEVEDLRKQLKRGSNGGGSGISARDQEKEDMRKQLEDLRKQLADKTSAHDESELLRLQVAELTSRRTADQQEIARHIQHEEELRSQLEKTKTDLGRQKEDLAFERKWAQESIRAAESKAESLEMLLDAARESQDGERMLLNLDLQERREELEQLRSELKSVYSEMDVVRQDLDERERDLLIVSAEQEEVKLALKAKEEALERYQVKLQTLGQEKGVVELNASILGRELEKERRQLEAEQGRAKQLAESVVHMQEELVKLQATNEAKKKESETLSALIRDQKERLEELVQQTDVDSVHLSKQKTELDALRGLLNHSTMELELLRSSAVKAEARANIAIQERDGEIKARDDKIAKLEAAHKAALEAKQAELKSAEERSLKEIGRLKQSIEAMSTGRGRLEQLSDLQAQFDESERQWAAERRAFEERVTALSSENVVLAESNQQLTQALEEGGAGTLSSTAAVLEKREWEDRVRDLEAEVGKRTVALENLQRELDGTRNELAAARDVVASKAERILTLEARLKTSKREGEETAASLTQSQAATEALQADFDSKTRALREQYEVLKNQHTATLSHEASLEAKVKELEELKISLEQSAAEKATEHDESLKELASIRERLNEAIQERWFAEQKAQKATSDAEKVARGGSSAPGPSGPTAAELDAKEREWNRKVQDLEGELKRQKFEAQAQRDKAKQKEIEQKKEMEKMEKVLRSLADQVVELEDDLATSEQACEEYEELVRQLRSQLGGNQVVETTTAHDESRDGSQKDAILI